MQIAVTVAYILELLADVLAAALVLIYMYSVYPPAMVLGMDRFSVNDVPQHSAESQGNPRTGGARCYR